jgi:hypothetical protein
VVGIERQHTAQRARAEGHAGVQHPDHPVGPGDQGPGSALQPLDRLHAHDRQAHHPVDDSVGARGLADAQPVCEHRQHTRDGAQTDAGACNQGQSQPDPLRLEMGRPGLVVAQVLRGLLEGLCGAIALLTKAREFCAQGAVVVGAFFGLVFPRLAALFAFGWLAHQVLPDHGRHPRRWMRWTLADQESAAQVAMHHESESGPRPEREPRDAGHILGKKIEPFWPFLDALVEMCPFLFVSPPLGRGFFGPRGFSAWLPSVHGRPDHAESPPCQGRSW